MKMIARGGLRRRWLLEMIVKACCWSELTIVANGGCSRNWASEVVAGVATGGGYRSMSLVMIVVTVGHRQWPTNGVIGNLEGGREKEVNMESLDKCVNFNSVYWRIWWS